MNRTNHTGVTISSVAPLRNISFRNIDAVSGNIESRRYFSIRCVAVRQPDALMTDAKEGREREKATFDALSFIGRTFPPAQCEAGRNQLGFGVEDGGVATSLETQRRASNSSTAEFLEILRRRDRKFKGDTYYPPLCNILRGSRNAGSFPPRLDFVLS